MRVVIDKDIEHEILVADYEGMADDMAGHVEGPGYFTYHEIDGQLYALKTDNYGFHTLIVFMGEDEMNEHKEWANSFYDSALEI